MPAYEYNCKDCKVPFTIQSRITEYTPASICPECGSNKVHRVFSPTHIKFNATGFYTIDSKHEQTYVTEIRGE
jgi:putative FmdB family regulatory protein